MGVLVCRYCCINYSRYFLLFCYYPFYPPGYRIEFFPGAGVHICRQRGQWGRAHSEPSLPHKSMHADFYWPITHRVTAVRASRLRRQQCPLCCVLRLGLNSVGGGGCWGAFSIVPDWQTAGQLGNEHRRCCPPSSRSASRSLPGPWENKGARLHLFSVSAPQGIKREDIYSRPARLRPTQLRGSSSPRSLRALFTHPADTACGTVVD